MCSDHSAPSGPEPKALHEPQQLFLERCLARCCSSVAFMVQDPMALSTPWWKAARRAGATTSGYWLTIKDRDVRYSSLITDEALVFLDALQNATLRHMLATAMVRVRA